MAIVQHLERYRVIAETFARHGLGVLLGASGIERFIPFHRSIARYAHRSQNYSTAQHVRLALEATDRLGNAYRRPFRVNTDLWAYDEGREREPGSGRSP